MICPKCGFEQPDGSTDCARCGVVFARYRATPEAGTLLPIEPISPISPLSALSPGSPALPPPGETLYGGPLEPPPPPPQLYGDASPPSFGRPGLHVGRTFELGAILGETFQTYFANFLPFLVLTAIAYAPVIVYSILVPTAGATPQATLRTGLLVILLRVVAGPLATATVTYGVFQQMRGRDTSIADCLKVGLSNLLPVLGIAILQGIAVGFGMILCLVPGFIALAMLAVSVPVAIEERPGLIAALNRSSELTDGYRWPVFAVLFILGVLAFGVGIVLGLFSIGLSSIPILATLVREGAAVVTSGLSATAAAVMYYRLRSVKESVDIESIASVFD
jgi:hypothetical protein